MNLEPGIFNRQLFSRQLQVIAKQTERRSYSPGDLIIRQGDAATELYLLLTGEVVVYNDGSDGEGHIIRRLRQRGDYFGEMGLLREDARRLASVRAVGAEDVEVLVIGRDTFVTMVGDSRQTHAVIKDEMYRRLTTGGAQSVE